MKAAAATGRAYGGLLSAGLSFAIVIQAMVNMGVAVGLGPHYGFTTSTIKYGRNIIYYLLDWLWVSF